jgi:cytochrome P450
LLRVRQGDAGGAQVTMAELLRLESPIPFTARVTTAPVPLPGGTVPAGKRVLLLLAAANRDERCSTTPTSCARIGGPTRSSHWPPGPTSVSVPRWC